MIDHIYKNIKKSWRFILNLSIVVMGLILLGFFFITPIFHQLWLPSQGDMAFIIYPKEAKLINARRQSIYPFAGFNLIDAKLAWPKEIEFESWYYNALKKLNPQKMEVNDKSFTVEIVVPQNKKSEILQINAKLHKNIVYYYLERKTTD